MTISRRAFSKQCAIATAGAALTGNVKLLARMKDDQIQRSQSHPVRPIQERETSQQRDARMQWFREARFGMFIHWGLYALPAGRWNGKEETKGWPGEWIMNVESIPVDQYKALAPRFNPTKFSAKEIVSLAKSAGMRYIVVTTKHHDGFAMFDSRADQFNIVQATPFKRDPLRELVSECRSQGMKLGFYYSQDQDWTAPGGAANKTGNHQPPTFHWDPAQNGNFAKYLESKAIPQIRELLANYDEFPVYLWFDSPTKDMTPELAGKVVSLLNEHPKLIWNNRLGGGYIGDTETPEQYIPARGFPGRDWESCMTMNDTWGYKADDTNFKSTEMLLRNLIDIASKGGNYLLNIGPRASGEVPVAEVNRLRAMGRWLAANGDSIYGTQATLFGAEAGSFSSTERDESGKPKFIPDWKWRSTTKPDKVFIQFFEWPGTTFRLEQIPRSVVGAYLLADKSQTPLRISRVDGDIDISLPEQPLDPIATVLVLETSPNTT